MDGTVLDEERRGSRSRRGLRRLAIAVLVLTVPVGGLVRLFQDELFSPFGDARACEGSERALPAVIAPGGVALPDDASDVHHVTRKGRAEVSFLSSRIPDYLHRTGILPPGAPLFDRKHGDHYALGDGEPELPVGLCGSPLRGPAWYYTNATVSVLVERSTLAPDRFPSPARAVVTYPLP
ncbi:hypothetical protein Q5762_17945 [Streptomyces sp. P9(2023)]|uniref:hypothetical protein n=1 Tax=Streptomyces sp. P9(2023) TaxID=3064394 RepID=UPI0028F436ED|nr:hypothetical protein [Streptomyces sp. P9(2023)]MDT9690188.1 hypothetical protein [Streptomyces sp. P9(2023)]